jgi:hypothetical protein
MRLVAPHAQGSQGEDNRSAENVLAEDGMPAKPGAHYPSDWTEKVRLAGAACHAGLYEAALVYVASAVRKIVAVATGGQDRPDNAYVAFALSRSPAIAPFVPATALLLEAAEMVGKGVPVRLGVSAPLATFWASILPAWVRDDVPGRLTPDISNTNAPEPSEPQ